MKRFRNSINKKGVAPLIIILIASVIVSIIGGGYYAVEKGYIQLPSFTQQLEFSKSACDFIRNQNNPNLTYTELTSASDYKCDTADECIVWGSLNIVNPISDNIWECAHKYCTTREFNSESACKAARLSCWSQLQGSYSFNCNYIGSTTGPTCKQISISNYTAKVGFCAGSNNPLCTKQVSYPSPTNIYTNILDSVNGEVLINGKATTPQSITFNPLYPNGSSVQKTLFIRKADCTCVENTPSNPTKACVGNTFKCLQCPSGYTYSATSNVYCPSTNGVTNICYNGSRYYPTSCVQPYTYKQSCDGSHNVSNSYGGTSSCSWWKTETKCGSNQRCYLNSTGSLLGEGVGDCRCVSNECSDGQVLILNDSTHFKKCIPVINSGVTCWGWDTGSSQCPEGLKIYKDPTNGKGSCVCDSSLPSYCDLSVSNKRCSTSGEQSCDKITIVDNIFNTNKECTFWSAVKPCDGSKTCNTQTGSCECLNQCTNKICDGESRYYDCNIPPGDVCKRQATTTTNVDAGQICRNNQLISDPKCDFAGCSDVDKKCVNSECVCKTSADDSTFCNANSASFCDGGVKTDCVAQSNGCWKKQQVLPIPSNKICSSGSYVCKITQPYCDNVGWVNKCNSEGKQVKCVSDNSGCFIEQIQPIPINNECKNGEYVPKTTGDYCDINVDSKKCISGNDGYISECKLVVTPNVYKWVTRNLSVEKQCITTNNVGSEVCRNTGDYRNQSTQPSCDSTSSNVRISWSQVGTTGCYKKTTYDCVSENKLCTSGSCESFGCGVVDIPDKETYLSQYACGDKKGLNDSNNLFYEICSNNQCSPNNDIYFVNINQSLITKCINNNIYKIQTYQGRNQQIKRWVVDKSCSGVTPICVQVGNDAKCEAPGDVSIVCLNNNECNYKIGEYFNNISIMIKPTLGNVSSIGIKAFLCLNSSSNCIRYPFPDAVSDIQASTNKEGMLMINCPGNCFKKGSLPYTTVKSDDYKIIVYIPNIGGSNYTSSPLALHVQPTLKLILSCDSSSYAINRLATCSWEVNDIDNPTKSITPDTTINIIQGGDIIKYDTIGTDSISFTTPSTKGNVLVKVSVSLSGYNGDDDVYSVEITDLERTQTLYIDNKKLSEYSASGGLTVGSHSLKIKVDESGENIPIRSIDANLITPSKDIIPLTFVKSGDDWVATTTDTKTPGATYEVKGVVKFLDPSKDDLKFDYTFILASGLVSPIEVNWIYYIIIGVVVIIVVLIILGLIFRKKKGVKR